SGVELASTSGWLEALSLLRRASPLPRAWASLDGLTADTWPNGRSRRLLALRQRFRALECQIWPPSSAPKFIRLTMNGSTVCHTKNQMDFATVRRSHTLRMRTHQR